MPRYTRTDIQRQIVGQLISTLEHESIVDVDEPEFIDKAMVLQREISADLRRQYSHLFP